MDRLTQTLRDPIFWKAFLVVLAIFAFIILYVKEFDQFNLMIRAKQLILPAVLTFVGLGLILGAWLQRDFVDPIEKLRTFMTCLIVAALIAPFFMSVTNRHLGGEAIRYEQVEFNRAEAFFASRFGSMRGETLNPTGYYIFFYYNAKLVRISVKGNIPELPEEGERMLIPVRRGFWGTDYIVQEAFGKEIKDIIG